MTADLIGWSDAGRIDTGRQGGDHSRLPACAQEQWC